MKRTMEKFTFLDMIVKYRFYLIEYNSYISLSSRMFVSSLLVRTTEPAKQVLQVKDTAVYVTKDSPVTTVNLVRNNWSHPFCSHATVW